MADIGGIVTVNSVETDGIDVYLYRGDTGVLLTQAVTGQGYSENPLQDYVQFHCHFDGANNATTATDVSGKSRSMTFNGSAKLDTTWGAFGSVSAMKPAASSNVTVTSDAAFGIGTGDFEVFCAYRSTNYSSPTNQDLFNIGLFSSGILLRTTSSGITLFVNNSSNTWTSSHSNNTDYYVKIFRKSGQIYCSKNGSLVGSPWSNTANIPAGALTIGTSAHGAASEYINGWVDEVRLMVGATLENEVVTSNLPDINDVIPVPTGGYFMRTNYTGDAYLVAVNPDTGNHLVKRITIS